MIRRFRVSGVEVALTPFTQMFPGGVVPSHMILSGPSILQIDYDQLDLGGVMGVNGAIRLRERHPHVRFSHYCIVDEHFVQDRREIMAEILGSDLGLFVTPIALFAILRSFRASDIRCRVCVVESLAERALLPEPSTFELEQRRSASVHVLDGARKLGFSFDPEQGVFDADTVAYSALQVLAAAGAQAIYFHGMDLSAPGPRFYESVGDVCTSNLSKNYHRHIEPSFAYASKLCRQKGIELYNLSMDSVLPDAIIPKVSWQLLALDPAGLHAKAARVQVAEDAVDRKIVAVPAFVAA